MNVTPNHAYCGIASAPPPRTSAQRTGLGPGLNFLSFYGKADAAAPPAQYFQHNFERLMTKWFAQLSSVLAWM
jgi:hypothetical protein